MSPEHRRVLHDLLASERLLALALLVDGEPHVGLLPFAQTADRTALLVHASRLAKHSRGLVAGASFSALVHRADRGDGDPLQLPRVTLEGTVVPVPHDAAGWAEARDAYLARLPSAAVTFQLGDFGLFALRIDGGRLVAGFAQAVNVSPEDLA